jgi:hypothetical protein
LHGNSCEHGKLHCLFASHLGTIITTAPTNPCKMVISTLDETLAWHQLNKNAEDENEGGEEPEGTRCTSSNPSAKDSQMKSSRLPFSFPLRIGAECNLCS